MMRRLNHHRAEMKKKILEEQGNHTTVKPQNMVTSTLPPFPVNFRSISTGVDPKSLTSFQFMQINFPCWCPRKKDGVH